MREYTLTPEEKEAEIRRLEAMGPRRAKPWELKIDREQYLSERAAGKSVEDMTLKHFNNERAKLTKQLKAWGMSSESDEAAEVEALAQGVKTELKVTKQEYLQRRLAGEGRANIIRTWGVSPNKAYKQLEDWGIREMDAEERELELLSPPKPAIEVDRRTSEMLEQKEELRAEPLSECAEISGRIEQRAADREQELANLQAAVVMWKHSAEQKDLKIQAFERELQDARAISAALEEQLATQRLAYEGQYELDKTRVTNLEEDRNRLKDGFENVVNELNQVRAQIGELETERAVLLQTIEAAASTESSSGYARILIPIVASNEPIRQRTLVYRNMDSFVAAVEEQAINRELAAQELFKLVQAYVSFVAAELGELLPGQSVENYVQSFIAHHNHRHIAAVSIPGQAAG
ncbi:hypothetical protein [Cohnella sp. JJ-181]|uniref:hypothetical protein n=1 Tax=Cohnella rhizoplanae TaxID=2974897 RepID=UPI0022FF6525|nr:hypothetical protein [Cohnella sp. JJ-181]CAI6087206.1 hypothetical protein COHCIP112018_05390 [Cohnella sp. JJ-181]